MKRALVGKTPLFEHDRELIGLLLLCAICAVIGNVYTLNVIVIYINNICVRCRKRCTPCYYKYIHQCVIDQNSEDAATRRALIMFIGRNRNDAILEMEAADKKRRLDYNLNRPLCIYKCNTQRLWYFFTPAPEVISGFENELNSAHMRKVSIKRVCHHLFPIGPWMSCFWFISKRS